MRNTTAVWLRVGMLAAMVAQLPTTGAPQATSSVAQPPVTSAAKPVVPKYFLLTITNAAPVPPLENRFEQSELVAAHEDLQAGRRDAAIARLEKLLRKTPNLLKAWETLGWAYWQAGREREAIALWERWREVDPGLPTPCNLLAQACIAHKELNRALEYYQQSLRLEPTQFDANYGLARLYRWTGDQDRAVEMFRNLLTRDPGRTDVKVELGRALLENDRFEEAAPIWAEMLQLSPTNQVFMLRQAMVLLYTGHAKESQALMGKILAQDPNNLAVYDMQADLAMASDHPEDAAPILRKIIQLSKDPQQRTQTRARLIRLLVRLNRKEPLRYSLDESLVLVRDMVRENPSNIDAQLMQGELLLVELKAEAAEQQFLHVLQTFNTDNLRARRGLFETYLTLRRFTDAEAQYKIIETFNPRYPYLHLYRARLEESRGNSSGVNQALKNMEQCASRGVVAMLLYHGLTTSDMQDTISVRQFRQHMEALKKAGFHFLTPDEIPAYFAKLNKASDLPRDAAPERAVCVTFDDARRDAMRLATDVARQLNVKFAMNVPVGNVERGDPFICTWEMLKQYQKTGCWVMGSHLLYSHDMLPVSADGQRGCPLINRLWLDKEGRLETTVEFTARIAQEYRRSRELLEQQLGSKVAFMAYPLGDFGQATAGNVTNAAAINLKEAGANYLEGFIQTPYGFAVNGDNPIIFERYEVERELTGEELVLRIFENHPYYMGLSYRAKVAAHEGRVYRAKELLGELQQIGYPEPLYTKVNTYVQSRLAGEFLAENKLGGVRKGPLEVEPTKPFVGVRGDFFRNNLDDHYWRLMGVGGLNLTPNLVVEGRAGMGQMRQPLTNSLPPVPPPPAIPDIKLTEKTAGIYPTFTFPNGWVLMGELTGRNFSGDVPTNLNGKVRSFDKTFLQYAVEGQGKIFAPLDVDVRFEHDAIPSARQIVHENTFNLVTANAVYDLSDWWQIMGAGEHFWFSDGNKRDHASVVSDWMLWEPVGLHAGLGYAFANARDANTDYWTPYRLNRYFAETGLRGNYLRAFYNLAVQYGVGKQSIRPEAEEAYQALLQRAKRERWPQSAQALITAPEANWQPVVQIKASTRVELGGPWELNAECAYSRVPDYNEFTLLGGLKYRF